MKTLEEKLAGGFSLGRLLDGCLDFAVDQDLPIVGISAEPGSEVDDCSDRPIVEPALKSDPAKGRVAVRDAHSESELVTCPSPFPYQLGNLIAHLRGPLTCPDVGLGTA